MDEYGIGIDPIDVQILREMFRTGKVTTAGIDPRLNASRIAARLRTSRARITHRLRRWSEAGFIRRYDVWPNPSLFELTGWAVEVHVADRLRKPELFERLRLVDGVVSAQEFLGEWVSVQFLARDEAEGRRKMELLRGLQGVQEVTPQAPWNALEPERPLTSLDVRIVQALRRRPQASLSETAAAVGVSTRTMTERYRRLLDGWAVWFTPVFDFTKLPLPEVALNLQLAPGTPREPVVRAILRAYPWTLEFARPGGGAPPPGEAVVLFITLPSPARIEELERFAAGVPGVTDASGFILVRTHSYPEAFDALLAVAAATARARAGPTARFSADAVSPETKSRSRVAAS